MKNYFKVFRVRSLFPEVEGGDRELTEEHFVFFDDSDQIATKRAASRAGMHIAVLEQKQMRAKVCAHARVAMYPLIEEVGEGL